MMEEEQRLLCQKAKRKALRLLEQRDRTEQNLRQKLAQNGYPPEAVEAAVEYVKSFGYVDDERYARNYLTYRLQTKSKQRLFQELYQRGISYEKLQEAWEEVTTYEDVDEKAMIRRQIRRKYAPGTKLDEVHLRRLYGFLARRGFQFEDIRAVLEEEGIEKV
ncbi:regulatory protein RecX [Blautia hydrogenotrophica]|uniref:Regulatory protein RecX n=1 Tax=Blautia hydrogenotrophica (strain DSM 10507 / JCM 14656 / S5a33) TaxID=476272 RepID=C0CLI5_BLAHS|nr:regulatory protein RecX [Blautia hydrogenotrophica]EEG49375.1 regulatory protein RecX [Blautia hydrogenotrophica DSM 10507]MCT6798448.1 regulatory protein RecX [Blautia hydrogenotrophica]WPX84051.1 Regulatory protein RecX [Blautia hydrogenotrophica DSM 10507]